MTRPGITALIPTFSEDVVALFKKNAAGEDEPILEGAHLMQVSIGEDVTFYKHPLENSRNLIDHRIIQPVTAELRIILTDRASILGAAIEGSLDFETTARDIYRDMRDAFIAGTFLSIQTRTATYANQVIQAMPHEETSTIFNGVIVSVSLSEILIETANTSFNPEDAEDSDTVERGRQNPLGLPSSVSDVTELFF